MNRIGWILVCVCLAIIGMPAWSQVEPVNQWISREPIGNSVSMIAATHSGVYVTANGMLFGRTAGPHVWKRVQIPASDIYSVASRWLEYCSITLVATPEGVFRDGCDSLGFQPLPDPVTGAQITFLLGVGSLPDYFVATGDSVFRSSWDGSTWEEIAAGLPPGPWRSVDYFPDAEVLFLAGAGGLFRSEDGGASWTHVPTPATSLQHVAVVGVPPTDLLVVTASGELLGSSDGGATWSPRTDGLSGAVVNRLAADPEDRRRIVAVAPEHGFYLSTDSGHHWNRMDLDGSPYTAGDFAFLLEGLAAATMDRGILLSTDDGTSWSDWSNGIAGMWILDLLPVPGSPNAMWSFYGNGVYRTEDRGRSWVFVKGLPGGILSAVNPRDSLHLAAAVAGEGIFESLDGGLTWNQVSILSLQDYPALIPHPSDASLWFLRDGNLTLLRSTDTMRSWQTVLEAPSGVIHVAGAGDPVTLFATSGTRVLRSRDHGSTWTEVMQFTRDVVNLAISPTNPAVVIAAPYFDHPMRSKDGGDSWEMFPGLPPIGAEWMAFSFDPADEMRVYGTGGNQVLVSNNMGDSWHSLEHGLPTPWGGERGIVVHPENPGYLYLKAWSRGLFTMSLQAPIISELTPSLGPTAGGTTVEIAGQHLGDTVGVRFGELDVPFEILGEGRLTVVSPPHPMGSFPVTVTSPFGVSQAASFTFLDPPVITSIDPPSGPISGNTTVLFRGTGFAMVEAVRFGDLPALTFEIVSPETILAVSPPVADVGGVAVQVVTAAGASNRDVVFTYQPIEAIPALFDFGLLLLALLIGGVALGVLWRRVGA